MRTYRCSIETEMSSRFATTEFARWIELVGTDQNSAETGGEILTFERGDANGEYLRPTRER